MFKLPVTIHISTIFVDILVHPLSLQDQVLITCKLSVKTLKLRLLFHSKGKGLLILMLSKRGED
jgi:hypothetical protein